MIATILHPAAGSAALQVNNLNSPIDEADKAAARMDLPRFASNAGNTLTQ